MTAGSKMAPQMTTNPTGTGGSLSAGSMAGRRRFNGSRVLILQNCPIEEIGLYETRLRELGIIHHTLHPYAGESFPPLDRYDAIIVGGTPVSVNQIGSHRFLLKEGRFLKRALSRGKHILGICFGAQLLARLLGAVVTRNPVLEIGAYPVRLTSAGRSDPLFKGFPQTFPVFHWHGDTFAIPPEGRRLATDRDCPNQAFRLGRAVGLQFHLEITPAEARRWAGAYKDELGSLGKNAPRLSSECRTHAAMMASLADLLLDNFLAGNRH
jgi:GMP synthase (glutamine-hydrolysing)